MLRGAKGFKLPSEIVVTPRIYLGCKLPLSHMSSKGRKSVWGLTSRMSWVARTATRSHLSETVPASGEEHRVGLLDTVNHILTFYFICIANHVSHNITAMLALAQPSIHLCYVHLSLFDLFPHFETASLKVLRYIRSNCCV